MKPYYEDELVTLYHGDGLSYADCWEGADVLVTDPPYGRDFRTVGGFRNAAGHGSSTARSIANDKDTSVRDAALEIWGDSPAVVFGDVMLAAPKGTRQVLIWHKPEDAGIRGATAGFRRDAEAIYLMGAWHSGIGGVTSVLKYGAHVAGPTGPAAIWGHSHSKPVGLMERLISLSPRAATIADPFAGSGSTLVAAKHLGRKSVGVELEERHCETIARRLSQEVLDLGALA